MFGAVRYINLDKRTDRKKEIEGELRRMGIENFKRFPAVNHEKTEIGCFLSHLNLLKEARDKKHKNVLVLEDDFEFVVSKEDFWKFMDSIKDLDYDVIMFVYNTQAHEDFNDKLIKVKSAQTAAGYLVNSNFYGALIENFEEALPKFIETGEHWHYANDQCWKSLQPHSKWYAFRPSIGKVRASYSDIQGKQTNDYRSTIGGSRRSKTRKSRSRRKMVRRKRTRTR
jgi:GR25 family glycosyltransferase involved in LPS biosynthesis